MTSRERPFWDKDEPFGPEAYAARMREAQGQNTANTKNPENKKKRKPRVEFTSERQDKYLEALAAGRNHEDACAAAGIGRHAVWKFRKANPDYDQECQEALDAAEWERVDRVERALYTNAETGNTGAQIFVLTNRKPDKWKQTARYEHTGKGGGPIQQEVRRIVTYDLSAAFNAITDPEPPEAEAGPTGDSAGTPPPGVHLYGGDGETLG